MRFRCVGILMVGLVLILAACGRVGPAAGKPSPFPFPSPTTSPVNIPISAFHDGEVGFNYAPVTLGANGGNSPYVWRISSGALPGGLTISAEDAIAGTPTESGSFTFTIEVTDAGLATASLSGTITVAPMLTASLARPGSIVIELGHSTDAFGSQTGGKPPYTYSVTAGTVPPGTNLDGLSLTGAVSSAGTYSFTATVTDSLGATASVNADYYVFPPIAWPPRPSGADADGWLSGGTNQTITTSVPYSGGAPGTTPLLTWTVLNPLTHEIITDPYAHDDLSVSLDGQAVRVTVGAHAMHTPGPPIYTSRYVAITLTDPVTNESTGEGLVRVELIWMR
jgi:hypothetical protein